MRKETIEKVMIVLGRVLIILVALLAEILKIFLRGVSVILRWLWNNLTRCPNTGESILTCGCPDCMGGEY